MCMCARNSRVRVLVREECEYACMPKPEVDTGCLPLSLTLLLYSRQGSSVDPELTDSARLTGQPAQASACLCGPGLRLRMHRHGSGDRITGTLLTTATPHRLPPNFSPLPFHQECHRWLPLPELTGFPGSHARLHCVQALLPQPAGTSLPLPPLETTEVISSPASS